MLVYCLYDRKSIHFCSLFNSYIFVYSLIQKQLINAFASKNKSFTGFKHRWKLGRTGNKLYIYTLCHKVPGFLSKNLLVIAVYGFYIFIY